MSTETYKIIKEVDGKWTLYASDAQNLSKDDALIKHDEAYKANSSSGRIKIALQDDARYNDGTDTGIEV
tara:strand:+ start:244 stop:450 length:207 start_codon:yes stop_codon:yes gene_type:complete